MPFTPLKSEHARRVIALQGTNFIAFMNCQGVEYPRNGQNDLLVPFNLFYNTPIPNANVLYFNTGVQDIVWAFPVSAIPVNNNGVPSQAGFIWYRKPRWPKGQ